MNEQVFKRLFSECNWKTLIRSNGSIEGWEFVWCGKVLCILLKREEGWEGLLSVET